MSQLSIDHLRPLVIGRGPVRLEALEVFDKLGMASFGLLLSRKDAYLRPYSQAPELRCLPSQCAVHLVPDYGPGAMTSDQVIQQAIDICQAHNYNAVFAGYGFLAEDPLLAERVQAAGLTFIGPSAHVSRQAGAKDAAKMTAARVGASVVPGFNCLLGMAMVMQTLNNTQSDNVWMLSEVQRFQAWPENTVDIEPGECWSDLLLATQAWIEHELAQGRAHLASDIIAKTALECMRVLWRDNPGYDIRIKAIHGGGGKGQRVLSPTDDLQEIQAALQGIWSEVSATGALANKNCVLELNIPAIRHWEVQLVGNGKWCVALGGRDCSLQRFEQKLVEFSLTQESLLAGSADHARLCALERDAVAFGQAVALDSVSTYEAIVSFDDRHFFMEMNTRLQVEHRVTEMVYGLEFPAHKGAESFRVESLVHLMCLLAAHGPDLPCPTRYTREPVSLEVRINAMNNALKPAAGGMLHFWSGPVSGELRDDQGLSRMNPDTGMPMSYGITGAYDSNLALSVVAGESQKAVLEKMLNTLGQMRLQGTYLETNIPALIGILAVLLQHPTEGIATDWIRGYLDMAACVQERLHERALPFNPHRVIAWYLVGDVDLLWTGPGDALGHLDSLESLCDELGIGAQREQGLCLGPSPVEDAGVILDPPPPLDDCLVRAPSGGVFYSQPGPGLTPFVNTGQSVSKGDTLCVVEVMKMFNPVLAPVDMVIESVLLSDAAAVKKGDGLFRFRVRTD